ncbi:anther-specific protein LAT52-like [Mercurialis annua]|uniref:anther-specific protein LAT52-like n=1 Tax=Mercurialis annua TaxID=3986 RepID=UPI00215EF232|nr:anther-specific protein LAT52-like [Mercurialis annua]
MAKIFFTFAALVASALCFSVAFAVDGIYVQGKVYCDVCRVEFETKISEPILGTSVNLECKNRENNTVTFTAEGTTDAEGIYKIPVVGDHEDDICEVRLVKSGRVDCSETFKTVDRARVLLTNNGGVVQKNRFANSLGFMTAKASPNCGKTLQDMGFLPLEVEA